MLIDDFVSSNFVIYHFSFERPENCPSYFSAKNQSDMCDRRRYLLYLGLLLGFFFEEVGMH